MIERFVLAVIDAVILTMALALPLELLFAPVGMGAFIAAVTILIITLMASPFIDLALSAWGNTPGQQRGTPGHI